ncbi:aspartate/glutamate racemase family protein [Hydrogenophaga luteola]|uniref:Aspartate/glutamate racemase family protein n=1 Tax=Hydrogenophaga luteola TaxID=1591122 RepID=A0ABV7W688_9BURK
MNGSDTGAVAFLGVIVLDTRFPRPPGDIGSPQTWVRAGIPARLRVVPGASARRVVQEQDPALLGPFIDAARSLAADGACLITTSCGFLAGWQAELQAAVPVPVITSSLLQCSDLPAPGIVTFDAASLHHALLRRAGVPDGTPVEGLAPGCELQSRILADNTLLDLAQAQRDVVAAAVQLVSRHPQVQTVVLECTNMPPYRAAVEQATGRPVHDLETLMLAAWRRAQSSSTRRAG